MVAQTSSISPDNDDKFSPEEHASMHVYATARASVAHVSVLSSSGEEPIAQGCAFLWDEKGHLVTNAHVVADGTRFRVSFQTPEKHTLDATLLGVDICRDVAVLSVDPADLPAVSCGLRLNAHHPRVGQRVHVLGAPFGLSHSYTTGVVSAIGREIIVREGRVPLFDVIQTDAAVNTGASGGPVLSSAGAVLGMTVAIASPSGAFAGIGFAIPVSTLRLSADALIASQGQRGPPCPALGLSFAPPRVALQLGLKNGLLVLAVRPDGAGDCSGLRGTRVVDGGRIILGDVLIAIAGNQVKLPVDVWREVRHKRHVGDSVVLTIRRQGVGEIHLNAVLRDAHDNGDDTEIGGNVGRIEKGIPGARL